MLQPNIQPAFSKRALYTELLMNLSSSMLNAMDEQVFFTLTLQNLGEALPFSRIYIFEYTDKVWNNTHEWTAPGVSPQIDKMQNIHMDELREEDSMLHCLLRGEVFSVADVSSIQGETTRNTLEQQGIRSILAVPLYFEGVVRGMFGFDICDTHVEWPSHDVDLIIAIGNLLSSAKGHFHMRRVLQAKEQQIHDIVDAFPDLIYVADMATYRVLFANKALVKLFGDVTSAETPCYKVFQNLDAPCPFCSSATLRAGGQPLIWQHYNTVIKRDFKIVDQCIPWEGVKKARLSIAMDITDVLKSQREEMYAKESSTAKSMFLAHMSHEIRTPLNGIIGLNYLALKANDSPAVEGYLRKMHHSSTMLLGVINDVLDFSKIEAGKLTLESAPLSIKDILHSVHIMMEPQLVSKRLQWNVRVDAAIPATLYGDPLRLSQVLQNVVSNAVKYTEQGSISINVGIETTAKDHMLLQVQVQDTGIGMSEKMLDALFVEFTQADTSATRKYLGAGLGLAIVKHLVEKMGGRVAVRSTEGKGTTLDFTVRLGLADEVQPTGFDMLTDDVVYPYLQGLRVLLCDDNSINQAITSEILRHQGCIVDVVDDGIEGVAMVTFHSYDVVLMDIQMPHMDGIEATQRIRENPDLDKMPIIAMTANAFKGDYEKSLAAGMQDHVTKPIDARHLYATLSRWCAPIRPDSIV